MTINTFQIRSAAVVAIACFALFWTACKQDASEQQTQSAPGQTQQINPVKQEKSGIVETGFTSATGEKGSSSKENVVKTRDGQVIGSSPSLGGPAGAGGMPIPVSRSASEKGWPMELPGALPKPPGVKLENYDRGTVNGIETWNIYLAEGAVDDLKPYEELLKDAGYKTSITTGNKGGTLKAEKGNIALTYTINLSVKKLTVEQKN